MKQKRNKTWKRMFSMLLVMAMLITAIPVTAFAEPEARAIRVWFEYDDGNTQELDENGEFHLTTEDKGTFKAEGYSSRRVGWMIFKQINQYTKEYWADYNSGVFQPHNESIVLPSWLEDFDTEQKLVEFKVNVEKAASIVEVKAFSGDREISMDAPCQMNGSEAQTLTLKVRKDNSEEFEPLALSNFDIEKVSGEGMILPADGTFRVDGQEAVFKATLKSDPSIFVEFKAVSSGVALQAISVSVPQVWYIDSWNGLADYYVGIQKGDNPDNNYKINYTPSNASDKEVVWEPLTEDIATHMEAFDNGIVPKKAGIAKFKVSSKSNPEISTEVSVEFRYKYPLTAANVEKEEYTVEEGNKLEFNIKATPEHATEQRFHWSYSKEGIVEVKDSVSQDALNVNTPKTTQHVINALKTGKVTVTGMPFDETGSCKPVSFDVVVTKDGEVPQGDALAMAKEDIAHGVQYLQGKSLENYENEWNIFSILRSGATIEQSKLDKYYESVVKQLKKSGKTMRVTDLARVALALEAMGKNPTDVDGFNVLEAIYNHKDMMTDSSNCPIFGLLALDGRNYEIPKDAKWSRKDLIDQILKFQKASGGFGLSLDNDTAGIDMTGMALQALAPYYDNSAYPEVKPAVDKALKYFKENIKTNAGFIEFGSENSCTTAQVLTAVSALNIDPTAKDSGFVQNGNNMISNLHTYKKDAGFAWQTTMQGQEMATQQVTYALVAYQRMAEGQTRLYDFTDVPEENPSVKPEAPKGTVTLTVERFTIGQGYFVEPVKVPFEEGDNGATLLKKVIGAENYIGNDAFLEAIKGADLGLDKVEVPDYIVKLSENETTTEKVKEYGNESNGPEALGEFDYSDDGKWVFFVNNKEPGSGTANYKPKDGDVLRFQFSVYGYGTDVTGQDWSGETVIEFSNKDRLTNLMAEVNKDKDNLMAHANVKNAYDAASKAISAVITPQKEIDALSDRLSEAMKNPGQPDIEDQKAAKEVEEKISGIGKVTLESKKAIEAARAAYDKLSENQKKLVSNLEILTKAEAELKKLEEEANTGYVIISVERFTIGQGFIHEPVKVPFEKGDNAATLLKKVIGAENFVGEDSYLRAIEGADLGVDKVVVPDYIAEISKNKVTTETARENGNDGDTALGEFDYSQMSGWMYHVNGKAVGYGISDYKPVNGDVLRFQFTMYGYGTDLTGTSWGNPNPVITISNKDNLVAKMADVNENRDRWMAVPAVKAVYDEAVKAMEAVITPKTEIDAITEKLDKAMKDHELTENDQEVANTVIEKINGIGKVTLESKKAIEEARAAYDKLSKNQKKLVSNLETLTKAEAELKKLEEEAAQAEADKKAAEAVVEKINGIGKVTLESKKAIEEARAAYDKLSKNQKKLVSNLETLTKAEAELKKLEEEAAQAEADKKAAEAVVEKINGIGKVTLESKKAIEEARAAYDKLSKNQKKLVSNLETLTKAEAELKKLEEEAAQAEADKKAAEAVVEKINGIGKVTLESKKAIEEARAAYDKLSKNQKKLVSNLETLTKAEAELKKLEEEAAQAEADKKAAEAVVEKINGIGKVTLESKKAIEEARAAYDKLSKNQKKLVSNLETLTKAEEELKKLEEEANTGYVIISVERFTIGQGFIYEPVKVPFEKGDNAATLLKKVIGAENFVGEDSYLRAIEGADLGVDKVVVPDYIAEISKNKVTTETARENGNDGDTALGEFDYSQMSGWMYHVNGKAVGYGISDYKPVNGDVLRFQFTMYGYGTDLTGTSWGNPNPVITISNKDNLVAKMADVNENRDRWMAVPAVKAVYDEAVKAMEAVITPKTEIDAITEKLDKAMKDHELTENDQEVANTVIEKINGIGKVTLESKKAIEEARAAYDKLSKNQKKLVSNLETLTKAEAELKKLEEEAAQAEADKKAAEAVVEKINGIGKVTLESKKAIEEARAAYDKLSKNQKKLVSNLETLTKAEAELKKLEEEAAQAEADKKAAEAVVEKINGIGKVTLESKKTIEEARAAYEKLSEAQKKLVSNLETLTKAEAELKKLEEQQGQQGQQGQEKPETSSVTLVNKKYGVSLQGEGLTEDMELQVEALNKDSKDVERMRKEITSKKSIFRLFNIKLMKDGKEIQLPQKAILSIPVGEKYNGKELVVLACSDKDIKQLKGKVTNGSVSVEVTELMSFGVVVDTAASGNEVNGGSGAGTTNSNGGGNSSGGKGVKTGDETQVGMLILLLTLSGAAVVMTAGKKRREQK